MASDMMAVGAVQALRAAGLRVPDDMALIGFDGVEQDRLAHLALSTVAQPVSELGRQAVRALLTLIEHPDREPVQRMLPTELIIRRSCGCHMESRTG